MTDASVKGTKYFQLGNKYEAVAGSRSVLRKKSQIFSIVCT
jgi:hypothetical protein